MYCKQCRYPLSQLRTPACPECGRAFDPGDARTFRRVAGRARLSFKTWLVLLRACYLGGYGAARSMHLIVRELSTTGFKAGAYVFDVRAGASKRSGRVGINATAELVACVYTPLRELEAGFWNWREDRNHRHDE